MANVLIVYGTRSDETKSIAELIGEGIRMAGQGAEIMPVAQVKKEEDIMGYDAYIFGSPTYPGEMITSMKQLLFIAERAQLSGKPGGAFGSYGWSGEAAGRIFNTMANVYGMEMMTAGPLMLKAAWVDGGMKAAHEYGREIANMVNG